MLFFFKQQVILDRFNMNINNLPSDCLLVILNKFPLQTQIGLRVVCHRWKSVIESNCERKRSLKLFGSFKNVHSYVEGLISSGTEHEPDLTLKPVGLDDDLVLNVAYFDVQVCHLLGALFPTIERLLVYFGIGYPFSHVPLMLQQWPQLSSLSICGNFYPAYLTDEICHQINRMPKLVCLNLFAANFVHPDELHLPLNQQLPKLRHFSLYNFSGNIFSVLQQLSLHCESLALNQVELVPEHLKKVLCSSTSNFRLSNVKYFQIMGLQMNKATQLVEFVCDNLTELQCLQIDFCRYPIVSAY